MSNEDPEWIKASEAYARLSASGNNPDQAHKILATYLRDGDLTARAEFVWKSGARFPRDAWKEKPSEPNPEIIPTGRWRHEKCNEEDRSQWRMKVNRFLVTTRLKPRSRTMMQGVEFRYADLQRLQPECFGSSRAGRRGPPPDISRRDSAWLAVLDLALANKLNAAEYESQGELVSVLHDQLAGRVGRDIITQVCRQAYPRIPQNPLAVAEAN